MAATVHPVARASKPRGALPRTPWLGEIREGALALQRYGLRSAWPLGLLQHLLDFCFDVQALAVDAPHGDTIFLVGDALTC